MKLITTAGAQSLPIKVIQYNTFFNRLRGLMFRTKPIVDEGILIEPCNSIHMFFMFFSIDVLFLNEKNEIVYLKQHVKPWTAIFPIKHAKSALELPAGTISKYRISNGDWIEI